MIALAHEQMTWTPSLADSERSLGSMYAEMPKDPAAAVPWYVRCLENPESSLALAGAIDLFGHDCIHILLGRGLLGQDEAFVIGYTMGASRRSSPWQERLFSFCARHVYQGPYRFRAADAEVFSLASRAAQCSPGAALHDVDFRSWWERPVGELRAALGLSSDFLRAVYAREAMSFPHTAASQRLATLLPRALHHRLAAS